MKVGGAARRKTYDPAYRPASGRLAPKRSARWPAERQRRQPDAENFGGEVSFELPSHHSITSSAVASSVGGTVRPSSRAVWWLMTSSNFVDCTTGKSAGFAPLRTRPV